MGVLVKKRVFNKHLFHVGNKFSTFFISDILYHTIFTALEEPDVQWALSNGHFLVKKTFDFDIGKLGGRSRRLSNKIIVVFEISAEVEIEVFSAYPSRL